MKKPLGIGLLSGGLDSALACLLLRDAGADVQCLHFFTGFCVTGHNSRVGRKDRPIDKEMRNTHTPSGNCRSLEYRRLAV